MALWGRIIKAVAVYGRKAFRYVKFGKHTQTLKNGSKVYKRKNPLFDIGTSHTVSKQGKVQSKTTSYPGGYVTFDYGKNYTHVQATKFEKLEDGAVSTKSIGALYENSMLRSNWFDLIAKEKTAVAGTIEYHRELPSYKGLGPSKWVHNYGLNDNSIMQMIDW